MSVDKCWSRFFTASRHVMLWVGLTLLSPGLFGAKGYQISAADELLPILKTALADNTVSIIACQVEYSENAKLTDKLGEFEFVIDPGK
jgi:hypothetical protein